VLEQGCDIIKILTTVFERPGPARSTMRPTVGGGWLLNVDMDGDAKRLWATWSTSHSLGDCGGGARRIGRC
jgi:hypothetical protein